jgi:putative membrane protein
MLAATGIIATLGLVFVGLAAVVHVVIFYFESIAWSQPKIWKRFGLRSQQDADVVKPMALNQGFYNLFLAIGVFVGIILIAAGTTDAGIAIALFAALSMVAAATVLIISNPKLARAALTQGALPLIGSVLLIVSLL